MCTKISQVKSVLSWLNSYNLAREQCVVSSKRAKQALALCSLLLSTLWHIFVMSTFAHPRVALQHTTALLSWRAKVQYKGKRNNGCFPSYGYCSSLSCCVPHELCIQMIWLISGFRIKYALKICMTRSPKFKQKSKENNRQTEIACIVNSQYLLIRPDTTSTTATFGSKQVKIKTHLANSSWQEIEIEPESTSRFSDHEENGTVHTRSKDMIHMSSWKTSHC